MLLAEMPNERNKSSIVYILRKAFLLPFTKVLRQNYKYQKDFLHQNSEWEVVSQFAI